MRFMVIVKGSDRYEAGELPSKKLLTDMGKFNEELAKAGVIEAGEGLQPSRKGARVRFKAGRPVSPTARSPKPRNSSAASGSGKSPPKPKPSSGPRASPLPTRTLRSKSARSLPPKISRPS